MREQVRHKTAVASPSTSDGQGIQRHTNPAHHRIPQVLDALVWKKIRGGLTQRLSLGPVLVSRTAAKVDVLSVGTILMAAMTAAEVINGLSGKGLRRKSGAGNDDLAMLIAVSGVSGLEAKHFQKDTACPASQVARSSSPSVPSAR